MQIENVSQLLVCIIKGNAKCGSGTNFYSMLSIYSPIPFLHLLILIHVYKGRDSSMYFSNSLPTVSRCNYSEG